MTSRHREDRIAGWQKRASRLHSLYREEEKLGKGKLITVWEATHANQMVNHLAQGGQLPEHLIGGNRKQEEKTPKLRTRSPKQKGRCNMTKENTKAATPTPTTVGNVFMRIKGLDAKSAKAAVEGTGADSADKNDSNGFDILFPMDAKMVKAAKEGGISSYGAIYGFHTNCEEAAVSLTNCPGGMLQTLNRLVKRSSHHLEKLGITFAVDSEEGGNIDVFCDFANEALVAAGHSSYDIGVCQSTVAILLIGRAFKNLSYTEHPLTYFDFSQALGIVQGVKEEMEDAIKIESMIAPILKTPKKKKAKAAKVGEKGVKPGKKPVVAPKAKAGKKKTPAPLPTEDEADGADDVDDTDPTE